MGLDMYLSARRYVSDYDFSNKEEKDIFKKAIETFGAEKFYDKSTPSATLEVTIGYWRKANAIHNFFVSKEENDDCRPIYVDREDLQELRKKCEEVLIRPEKAKDLLPTTSGFFFGSTEYSIGYKEDLEHTISIINKCLEMPSCWEFSYCASW